MFYLTYVSDCCIFPVQKSFAGKRRQIFLSLVVIAFNEFRDFRKVSAKLVFNSGQLKPLVFRLAGIHGQNAFQHQSPEAAVWTAGWQQSTLQNYKIKQLFK
ncbi:MAG: hypothetical protein ABRQ35_06380 [Smithellaceae bacterium]